MHQQANSPLFKLPPELRLIVYELAIGGPVASFSNQRLDLMAADEAAPSDTLSMVCKAINRETQELIHACTQAYWQTTVFQLNLDKSPLRWRDQAEILAQTANSRPVHHLCATLRPILTKFEATAHFVRRDGVWKVFLEDAFWLLADATQHADLTMATQSVECNLQWVLEDDRLHFPQVRGDCLRNIRLQMALLFVQSDGGAWAPWHECTPICDQRAAQK